MSLLKLSTLCLPFLGMTVVAQDNPIVQVHGSGTANPKLCYWHIMEEMQAQAKQSIRMTFRSVGTGQGQLEFMGNASFYPDNHFSSGDYPMSKEDYTALQDDGIEMLHLPVLAGPVGLFHSVPVKEGHTLNMTSCLVARVMKRDITDWTHKDIKDINPNLDIPVKLDNYGNPHPDQSFPVSVAHRVLGSSSTQAVTTYLHKSCPSEWGEEFVGNEIEWHEDTKPCQGSSGMVQCIKEAPGTIGYMDSGLGHNEGLGEVALEMDVVEFRNGDFYLTSENSINKGGILPVLDEANIPADVFSDWSEVDLINQVQGYVYSWPMVLITYIYVRKDLTSFLPDPRAQTLLATFLKNLYEETYVDVCVDRYKFIRIEGKLRDMALEGLDKLVTSPDAPEWIVEDDEIMIEGGQGDYVISTQRSTTASFEQEILISTVKDSKSQIKALETEVEMLKSLLVENATDSEELEDANALDFGDQEEKRLNASFILAIVSLCLWFVTIGFLFFLRSRMIDLIASEASKAAVAAHHKPHKKSSLKHREGEEQPL